MSRFGWKIYGGDLHMQRFPILSPAYTKGEGLRNLPKKEETLLFTVLS